jgi:hypothetical protein
MLLRFAMCCLICALVAGVFGFEDTRHTLQVTTTWGRYLFPPLAIVAVAAMTAGIWNVGHADFAYRQSESVSRTIRDHDSQEVDVCLADSTNT